VSRGGPTVNEAKEIVAYHGSPHDFDRFDLSKIGTGEGAQSYGHGLYFAENEGVAKSYQDQLAGSIKLKSDSLEVPNRPLASKAVVERDSGNVLAAHGGDFEKAIAAYSSDDVASVLRFWKNKGAIAEVNPGRMYQVSIKADPEHFLDWDKPLSGQRPKI